MPASPAAHGLPQGASGINFVAGHGGVKDALPFPLTSSGLPDGALRFKSAWCGLGGKCPSISSKDWGCWVLETVGLLASQA